MATLLSPGKGSPRRPHPASNVPSAWKRRRLKGRKDLPVAIALETLGGGFRGQRWKERSRNRAEGARALVLPSVTAVSHLSSTCWPQNLPLPVPSGSEQGLSVGKGREGSGGEKLPGQPSQVLSLPVGILQGRKQSCSRGARCSPRGAERRPAQSQAERLVPSPASAPQLLPQRPLSRLPSGLQPGLGWQD